MNRIQRTLILILIISGSASYLFSQKSTQLANALQIEKTVQDLFDGMRAGDSTKVGSQFADEARLMSAFTNNEGKEMMKEGSLQRFLNQVGTPHDEIYDEQISNLNIAVDGNLASAWMDYSFYVGDQFSHCGVNSMQLVRRNNKWKIVSIIDTRRKTNCNE